MLVRARRRFYSAMVSADWSAQEMAAGVQALPFEIRQVATREQFESVLDQRVAGYHLADRAAAIDAMDYADNALVLAAFDKTDDRVLGSIRFNLGDRGPNEVTEFVDFPSPFDRLSKIEARRFVVPRSALSMKVKVMLMKALYMIAETEEIGAIVATSAEGLASTYRMMLMEDLAPGGVSIMPPGARKPATVLAIETATLRAKWQADVELKNFYRICFEQTHPDLHLDVRRRVNPLSRRSVERHGRPQPGAREAALMRA